MPRVSRLLLSFPAVMMICALGVTWMVPQTARAQDMAFSPSEVTTPLVALVPSEAFRRGAVPPVGLVAPIPEVVVGQEPLRRPAALPPLYVSFAALQALDVHSTMKAVGEGGAETNPVMNGLVRQPAAFVAAKVAATAATFYVSERLWRRHRVGAVVLMLAVNGAYAAIVANNYRR